MWKYKRYLLDGGKVPRSTAFYQRKRNEKQQAIRLQTNHSELKEGSDDAPSFVQNAEQASTSKEIQGDHGLVGAASTSLFTSDSESENDSVQCSASRPTKRQKSKAIMETAVYASSSDESSDFDVLISESEDITDKVHIPCKAMNSDEREVVSNSSKNIPLLEAKTLCPCTNCTENDVILMVVTLGLRHSLSWSAQLDILKLINAIYGTDKVCHTQHHLENKINFHKKNISHHYYCTNCNDYCDSANKHNENETDEIAVECPTCETQIDIKRADNYFLSVSIESQLTNFVQDCAFASTLLNHRFNREKIHHDSIEDIYDGIQYKKHFENNGILACPYNFSYSFFTDGVALGKSSNKSIWPIYLTINELPFEERNKFIILAGMYVGPKDPCINTFLKPFVQQANKLSSDGFKWIHDGKEVVSKVLPLCAIADSVARCKLLNFQTFHAYHGCTFCYQQGVHTRRGTRYTVQLEPAPLRTVSSTLEDLSIAFERRYEINDRDRHSRGVLGPSVLMELKHFDFISGFVVDYMHCVLLGVIRSHTMLLLDPMWKKVWEGMDDDRVGIEHLKTCIDDRLLTIKPPSSISRTPRSICQMKMWKANEWRSWLLFYCIPCLSGLLRNKYLLHIALLSKVTNLLLQKSLSYDVLEEAHSLLLSYCFFHQKYFHEENMMYNFHLLTHISKCVLNWGPIWGHDAFSYESQNRYLLQLFQSPNHVALQIVRKFLIYSTLPMLCSNANSSVAVEYSERVLTKKLQKFVRTTEGCILLGKASTCELPGVASQSFKRMIWAKRRISTYAYQNSKKNNDSCLYLTSGKYFITRDIVLLPNNSVLIFGQEIFVKRNPLLKNDIMQFKEIREVESYGPLVSINPFDILCHCILIGGERNGLIMKVPYGCLND